MQLTIGDLHELLGGALRFGAMPPRDGDAALVGRVVTDSRTVEPEEVFWGLVGPRFNGAHFGEEAFVRGASGVVTSGRRVEPWAGRWSLEVDDSHRALWELADWSRRQFTAPLVAVTGSVGKTTTRRMIDTVLGSRLAGTTSPKNFNNHVGVPLSLMRLERWHQYAVLELAATARGEIRQLAMLARPRIGVITHIADAHLGSFGSHQAIAQAKAELLPELPADGCAVLDGDDPLLRRMAGNCPTRIVWVGRGADNDVQAKLVQSRNGRLRFRVDGHSFDVPVWGRHHLTAALAAIAVGRLFDFDPEEIAAALAGFEGSPRRCEVTEAAGATIVDDSYNSSPTAMRAALGLIREIDSAGRRIVVAGDMGDLGAAAPLWHRRLGEEVVSLCGADLLIACGDHAAEMATAAAAAGMPRDCALACRDWEQALPVLAEAMRRGDVVLVKGARVMGMERLVEAIKARHTVAAAA
ncbi:MAG TPA: UDP-N-acetylmuramoyl-tripeptide--D-alanyl-D-alanine ligase [Pirellulales bacterium]|jgi:UDP-N-acetylmuramoyl-tripeptide--D-alanyl-D-alanine ligase|nr:UDP-N-acetylmuramoyl-tripeptide--D-alanyl-D-alanine ligase [Pirellulales bacterium]